METVIYVRTSKESNAELGRRIGLTGKALDYFLYACLDVELIVDVDRETGHTTIVACGGQRLPEPVGA